LSPTSPSARSGSACSSKAPLGEDVESYDRATDFERMGGQLIELPANDWRRIAEAA